MNRDILELKNQIDSSAVKRTQTENQLWIDNETLTRELTSIKHEFDKYREHSQNEIASLLSYNKEIKTQHELLIKSGESFRANEMRYRDLVSLKHNNMKLTNNVDHLWAIKEVEYGNVREMLDALALTM
jgi:hypothetical protein